MKFLTTIILASSLTLVACGKKDKAEPPAAGSNAPAAGSDTGSAAPVADTGGGSGSAADSGSGSAAEAAAEIPTEVDFEAIATEEITDKTVDAKVKALEADLAL